MSLAMSVMDDDWISKRNGSDLKWMIVSKIDHEARREMVMAIDVAMRHCNMNSMFPVISQTTTALEYV